MNTVGKRTAGIAEVFGGGKRVAWRAFYRPVGKAETSRDFRTKPQAQNFLAQLRVKRANGTSLDNELGRSTVRQYGEKWLARQVDQRDRTLKRYGYSLGYLFEYMGDSRLIAVTSGDLEEWLKWLKKDRKLAANTRRVAWARARKLFKSAVIDRGIPFSPCEGVKAPAADRDDFVPLSWDEVAKIAVLLPAHWRALAIIGAQTGLRPGELLGLCREQLVDFLTKTPAIRVDRQLSENVVVLYTKTKTSTRRVTLRPETILALNAQIRDYPPGPDGRLFQVGDDMRETWRHAVERAKIGRRVTPHALRHFHASDLLAQGHTTAFVAKRLGHADPSITDKVYAHVMPSEEDRFMAAKHEHMATYPDQEVRSRAGFALDGESPKASDQGK